VFVSVVGMPFNLVAVLVIPGSSPPALFEREAIT
jgi:hypothetical protein